MNKYIALLSALALGACMGGGSNEVGMTDYERAAASNAAITGMVSRIQDGDSYGSLSRSASHRGASARDGLTTVFLDNVLFESADKQYDTEHPDYDFTMRFHVDANGRIDAINMVDDGETGVIARAPGDTNEFGFTDETESVQAFVNLFGVKKGLTYADFGFLDIHGQTFDENGNVDNVTQFIMPIAGGYETKNLTSRMDKDDFDNDIVFEGIAVADVGEPSTLAEGERLTLRDDSATLTFKQDTGNEIFNASFREWTDETTGAHYDNWYDVEAIKYNSGENAGKASIAFTEVAGREVAAGFTATNSGVVDNNQAAHSLSVGFNYYGDTPDAPQEATGIIHYQHVPTEQPFLMGFGGKLQPEQP